MATIRSTAVPALFLAIIQRPYGLVIDANSYYFNALSIIAKGQAEELGG